MLASQGPKTLRYLVLAGCLGAVFLSGCGNSTISSGGSTAAPTPSLPTTLQGHVSAGGGNVTGAQISLYATGIVSSGSTLVDLLQTAGITTDASGNFTVTALFTCPAATTQVYLVARGGKPAASTRENAALVLTAPLGDCKNLSPTNTIVVNEVTTAVAALALSQFLQPSAVIASSSTNSAGLSHAFQIAQKLVNTSTGLASQTALPTGAVAEISKINTLANVLAPCAGSDGSTACAALFLAAAAGGPQPTSILDAALNIVRNPGTNVSNLFKLAAAGSPFSPALTAAPTDWTVSITYSGGGLNQPGSLAVNSAGNIWVANYFGAVVSGFSPTGTPLSAIGFAGVGLHNSFGVAIDPSDNVWVSNENSVTATGTFGPGSVSKFSSAGAELSGTGYTDGGIYFPEGIASDSAGNIWIANYGISSASLIKNNGTAISGVNGYGLGSLPFPTAVAVDAGGNGWFAAQNAAVKVTPAGVVTKFACCVYPAGIALDRSGNVWLADYGGASIVKLTSTGSVVATVASTGGANASLAIAVDGAGQVFAANYRGNSITELAGLNAALISPVAGFGVDAPLSEPFGIAIDASGNVWVSNLNTNTVSELLGLASPVKTPMTGPPVAP